MDQLVFGLSVAGIGLLVVFVGLILLIFCIKGISKFSTTGNKGGGQKSIAPAAPVKAPVTAPTVQLESGGIPADVIAAITAAVAAVWQGEGGFVVKHIRRISNAPVWNRAGREEQTYSRF